VPCCPSNLSRTWADLGKYIYSSDSDAIWFHQYIGSKARLLTGVQVDIETESGFPWNGKIRINIDLAAPAEFAIHLRIPSWISSPEKFSAVKVNSEAQTPSIKPLAFNYLTSETTAQGYDPRQSRFLSIQYPWSAGDVLELDFDMPICLRRAHPKVKGHRDKIAVTRGPLVYCLESADNPGVDIFSTRLDTTSLVPISAPELLNGITILRGRSIDGQPLTFIPYHLWANRGESKMTVWVII
jgi:DUF1680 family protein